ncbi:MAG: PAS domain-containing protein [bacterium]|nr:PAS domain-containing protein [bacterium]
MKPPRKPRASSAPTPTEAPNPDAPTENPTESVGTPFPIVGIGASAGGLAAFEAFFAGMPAGSDPGMAFVLVQHLDPDHKSILTELIGRYTTMKVYEVEDGMKVRINCAYIIPPNRDMALLNGSLHLMEPSAPRGRRLPIDFFFRSLAQDLHEKAVCVVLSGTGSDGTLGVRAVKGEGGLVMAQDPATTEYDGMPRNAVATGLVDFVLPPGEMAAQIISFVTRARGRASGVSGAVQPQTENALRKVFILLRAQTGHDFSQYKPSTVHRRIERRLVVNQLDSMDDYVKFIQQSPVEIEALFRDLLIGVTSFFRDPEAFDALRTQVLPKLFDRRTPGSLIRVWSTGCSTGEEPYSLAMLLHEYNEEMKQGFKLQIFATDIDSQAVATARAGMYPANIASDISPERLSRYFTREPGGGSYRINKVIRDMLVFSEHDLLKDPPFSKLDLISCRNLLIYLDTDLQKRVIPLFHYALNPGGLLFLGTSETVGDHNDLFAMIDRKAKLYQRKMEMPGTRRPIIDRFLANRPLAMAVVSPGGDSPGDGRLPLRELTERTLLQQFAPAAALVDAGGDIHFVHGRTGRYLEPAPGEAGVSNILKMARDGLRRDLTTALHKAALGPEVVSCPGLRVRTDDDFVLVDLVVTPVGQGAGEPAAPSLFLVSLSDAVAPAPSQAAAAGAMEDAAGHDADADPRITALKQELRANQEYLQAANEELETANEELRSSNEEMQSVNEELQSTNEELETSKEELQSMNEELSTVNAELQAKVTDLSRVNNDMNNLLAGSNIGTVFVDHQLRILRFTPASTRIINLIQGDTGRPVGHLASNLVGYDRLVADVQAVLDTLVPREVEVQAKAGPWYAMRIQPYRTLENVIEGAVITFVEITKMKQTQEAMIESESCFRQMSQALPQLVWTCKPDGRCEWLSPQWCAYTGAPSGEPTSGGWLDSVHPDDRLALSRAWSTALAGGEPLTARARIRNHLGEYRRFHVTATALRDAGNRIVRWFGTCGEIDGETGGAS